jgi:hypothetical protein
MRTLSICLLVLLLTGCYTTRSGNVMEWDTSLQTANISYLDLPDTQSGYKIIQSNIELDNSNAMAATMRAEQQANDTNTAVSNMHHLNADF